MDPIDFKFSSDAKQGRAMLDLQVLSANNWHITRRVIGLGLLAGGIYSTLISGLWLLEGFIQLSVNSPNLDQATRVDDFNDLAYIGQALESHFSLAVITLLAALFMITQAVLLFIQKPAQYLLIGVSCAAILFQLILLIRDFQFPYFSFLILSTIGLYLVTDMMSESHMNK